MKHSNLSSGLKTAIISAIVLMIIAAVGIIVYINQQNDRVEYYKMIAFEERLNRFDNELRRLDTGWARLKNEAETADLEKLNRLKIETAQLREDAAQLREDAARLKDEAEDARIYEELEESAAHIAGGLEEISIRIAVYLEVAEQQGDTMPVSEPPITDDSPTTPPATTTPPVTEPPATTTPPVTEPPATQPPTTMPPASELDGTWISGAYFSPSQGMHSFYYTFSGEEFQYGKISGGSKHRSFAGTFTIEGDEIELFVKGNSVEKLSFSQTGNTITIGSSDYIKE